MNSSRTRLRTVRIYRRTEWSTFWYKVVEIEDAQMIEDVVAANLTKVSPGEVVLAQWGCNHDPGAILIFRIGATAERITLEESA